MLSKVPSAYIIGGAVLGVVGVITAIVLWFNVTIDDAYDRGEEAGRAAASLECAEKAEAAQAAHDERQAELKQKEQDKRSALEARLAEEADRGDALEARLAAANTQRRNERARHATELLNIYAGTDVSTCSADERLRDADSPGLDRLLNRTADPDGVRGGEAGASE